VDASGVLAGKRLTGLSVGAKHTCALDDAGKAYCWGFGTAGRLGNGGVTNQNAPVAVSASGVLTGKKLVQIAAGFALTCALDDTGRAYCWGDASLLGDGSNTASSVPVAVSTSGVLAGTTLTAIAAGDSHACVLDSTGKAYCWGDGVSGQLGNGGNSISRVPVAVNAATTLSGRTLVSIAAGGQHSCATDTAGLGFCWGFGTSGQLGNGTNTSSAVAVPIDTAGVLNGRQLRLVTAGVSHACAVDGTGTAHCWGRGPDGQLGNGAFANQNVSVSVANFG
jgi:alpha-tubulin suppressor-like RCC1 family protein